MLHQPAVSENAPRDAGLDDLSQDESTLVEKVMGIIRGRIAALSLSPGARLPSIRRLAATMDVSKSTVVEAYDRLVAEGVIQSRRGAGFFVAGRAQAFALTPSAPRLDREIDPLWIMRQSLEADSTALKPGCGWLPEDWLPQESIRRAMRSLAREEAAIFTEYGDPLGYAPLRLHLSRRLGEQGVEAGPDQILLVDSGTHALDLLCRFFLQPGDAVLVDDPCYFNFQALLQTHRVRLVGVPYTPGGPDLDAFARAAEEHRPKLYIANAGLHNPTGGMMTPAVAHRLLKLVEQHGMIVIEDNIFADFHASPSPLLAELDGLERIVHIGSFSKTLTAAARLGYIAARGDWIDRLIDLKLATTFGNSQLSAQLVHTLLIDGSYRRHVEALRTRLAAAMTLASNRLKAAGLELWTEPQGGMFLWARLPAGMDSALIARHALERGVVFAPGNVFSLGQNSANYLRFNVAQSAQPRIFEVLHDAMLTSARGSRFGY
jgi:DNA-binding transcriptional MocR family regulator